MTTKLKLISISLALFLIVALSAALAFALPKEEFNLSGSLSYEPSFVSYTLVAGDLIPADFQLKLFNDGTFELDYDVTAIQYKMKRICNGFIGENGRAVVKEQSLQHFNPLTGEKLFPSLKDQRPLISDPNLIPSRAPIGFLNENIFYLGGALLIREGLDPSAVAFVGSMNRLEEGCDLTLPRQDKELTGDALKEQFGDTWLTLLTGTKAYYNSISIKDIISFSQFDQRTTGLKTVQITFPSPIDNSEIISAEIKVFVYEDEADLPGNQLSYLGPSSSANETLSLAIPRGATAKQFVDHINDPMFNNWLDYYSSSGSERVDITEDMISEFTINGDKGYCKVTYKDASAYLQFYVYEEGEENLPLALTNLPSEELFVMPAGNTINYSEKGLYVFTNSAEPLVVKELYQNGVKISQEELFATGGEKNYQIEFVGGNGTTIYLDMKTFVYDASYSVPTHAALSSGYSDAVPILEDGSLDLEGLYITIYYNGKENSMSNPDLIPEVDHVEVPLSSEDVKIEYVVDGNTAIIASISIKINFNGHEVYHGLTNH